MGITGVVLVAMGSMSCSGGIKISEDRESKILVDQFGYRPQDPKVAVVIGHPDGAQSYELKDVETNQVIDVITPIKWGDGAFHPQSGERAWWVDFSEVKEPGSYVLVREDEETRSAEFDIRDDVYRDVLIAATKMFFYQRSGFAKEEPFADPRWTDAAAYLGPDQDTEARFVHDKSNLGLVRDMRGGWFDAGDTNKYVTYASQPVHQLLSAYGQNPKIWTDDFNIPESGNGIPDLLDEVKFELDWFMRMQDDDGGAFIKLGVLDYSEATTIPSQDKRPRYYGPKCSSSTITLASTFAHASYEMRSFPELKDYADELQARSIAAWNWYQNNPIETDCDNEEIKSGDADLSPEDQLGISITAAVYLFAITGDLKYSDYVAQNVYSSTPFNDGAWSRYNPIQGDALLFYTQLSNADSALKQEILDAFELTLTENTDSYGNDDALDPFRAYMPDEQYHWGSNQVKANYGNTNYDPVLLGINVAEWFDYTERALGTINYFHGVNPLGIVYLSNMYEYGAENSINEIYHQWLGFGDYQNAVTSKRGPAPGYLAGGPNGSYSGDSELAAGPPMKAYIDTSEFDLLAWEITEPAIYYQSSYVKLLSKFVTADEE
ncbi:MAG: glycoside hydrolase family 9 protein [Cyanobacteria bacterium P01_B01_bin.77]